MSTLNKSAAVTVVRHLAAQVFTLNEHSFIQEMSAGIGPDGRIWTACGLGFDVHLYIEGVKGPGGKDFFGPLGDGGNVFFLDGFVCFMEMEIDFDGPTSTEVTDVRVYMRTIVTDADPHDPGRELPRLRVPDVMIPTSSSKEGTVVLRELNGALNIGAVEVPVPEAVRAQVRAQLSWNRERWIPQDYDDAASIAAQEIVQRYLKQPDADRRQAAGTTFMYKPAHGERLAGRWRLDRSFVGAEPRVRLGLVDGDEIIPGTLGPEYQAIHAVRVIGEGAATQLVYVARNVRRIYRVTVPLPQP